MKTRPTVIDTYIEAYNRKDVDAMLGCLSEAVRFRNLAGDEVTAETVTKAEFEALARFGATAFSARHQNITRSITVADTTLLEIDYTATVAIDLPNGWTAGQALAFSGASCFQVEGGLIVSLIDQS